MKPINGMYPACKFAMTALTECLRQEVNYLDLPVKVTVSVSMSTHTHTHNLAERMIHSVTTAAEHQSRPDRERHPDHPFADNEEPG